MSMRPPSSPSGPSTRSADLASSDRPKKRRRPALACVQCRRRKIRCDQERPCNNCVKSRIPDCTFPETHIPGSLHDEPDRRVQSQAPRVEVPEQNGLPHLQVIPLRSGLQQSGTHVALDYPEGAILPRAGEVVLAPSRTENLHERLVREDSVDTLKRKIDQLEDTIKKLNNTEGQPKNESIAPRPLPESGPELRFGNQSTWMNHTSLASRVLRPVGQAQNVDSDLRRTFRRCKAVGGQINKRLEVSQAPETIGTRLPDRQIADRFLESYFLHFESWTRVLHIPSFRAEYEKFWQRRDTASDLFVLQLQVCLALGSTAHRDCLEWRNASSQWLLEAHKRIQSSFKKRQKPPTFEELQLNCLVIIAEANASEQELMHQCWVDIGDLVRRAMWAGLHRDPKGMKDVTFLQAELRRRLWATILELNLLLSLQAGKSLMLSSYDYDTLPPGNFNDEDLTEGACEDPSISTGSTDDQLTETTAQRAFLGSFRLRSEIVSKVNGIGLSMSYDEVLKLHAELSKARNKVNSLITTLTRNKTDSFVVSFTATQKPLLDILMSRYFLALHLPVLGLSIKNPAFYFSRSFCAVTTVNMAKATGVGLPNRQDDPHCLLFVNSAGLFRHLAIQAVFALALEYVTAKEEEFENGAALTARDISELEQLLEAAQDWAWQRISSGLVDYRPFCFIGACLLYASQQGSDKSKAVLEKELVDETQKDSERCLELLNGVAEKLEVSANEHATPASGMGSISGSEGFIDGSFETMGDFLRNGMDGFRFEWSYPIDQGLDSTLGGMNMGYMAL